jgi:hypothetical protein
MDNNVTLIKAETKEKFQVNVKGIEVSCSLVIWQFGKVLEGND